MGIFDQVATQRSSGFNLFSGNSPMAQIGNRLANEAISYGRSKMSSNNLPYFDAVNSAVNGYIDGGLAGAVGAVVNSGILNKLVSQQFPVNRWTSHSKLHAGLSLAEVQKLAMLAYATEHAHKNLWLLRIEPYSADVKHSLTEMISNAVGHSVGGVVGDKWGASWGSVAQNAAKQAVNTAINSTPVLNSLSDKGGGMTNVHNMLATNVSYTPFSIEADPYSIGSAIIDNPKSSAKAELSISSMDDEYGTIKRWFKNMASRVIHSDGTVGLTSEGLVKITLLHAFISDHTNQGGFEESIVCRPVSLDYELDRRTDELQEFTMRFEQTDTFIK